jgi:hypothetical protein
VGVSAIMPRPTATGRITHWRRGTHQQWSSPRAVQAAGKEEMRSGWFWGTEMWQQYLQEYAKTRPECLREWKSSPLADDHDFQLSLSDEAFYRKEEHQSQVIDLRTHKWSDIRKSYRGLINQAMKNIGIEKTCLGYKFQTIHQDTFGSTRTQRTYDIQGEWLKGGLAQAFIAYKYTPSGEEVYVAGALWIVYRNCAYYASGPSIYDNVQHAVIFRSLEALRSYGVTLVDMGQIDGETEKERNIGKFKQGFGGEAKPFTIVRRTI